jgi:hypothetical protein
MEFAKIFDTVLKPGLPDGIFFNQKSQFRSLLEGLSMEDDGVFYGHLVHFQTVWSIFRPFGPFSDHLVYFMAIWYIFPVSVFFPPLWYVVPRQIWQPWLKPIPALLTQ